MNNNVNRRLKRCPECKSGKIYRRVRAKVWSANAKGRKGNVVEKFEKLSKTYFCQKCRHEFDVPLILDEIIHDDVNDGANRDIKEEGKGCIKIGKTRKVRIPIYGIMDDLVQRVMNEYGVEHNEIKCSTKMKNVIFDIPALDKTLCNEVMPALSEYDSCGNTKGGCLCGLGKGHNGLHVCKRCSGEWETQE